MTSILLIYPYFRPIKDKSTFRFPPLGLGYIASSLRNSGYNPELLDCTFMDRDESLQEALESGAEVVGIYCMFTMHDDSQRFARILKDHCDLLIAGGPLPSSDPISFIREGFDIAVIGEGEHTISEILQAYEDGSDFASVKGIVYRKNEKPVFTPRRKLELDLDSISFPARDLFSNQIYIDHWKARFGHAATTLITTRGCPFSCEFCSNAVFGSSYRERSSENVLNEVEEALSLGFDKIHFADDVFTLNRQRLLRICDEISKRDLEFEWECLARVDSIDRRIAGEMKKAGCERIFFGIESGNDSILKLMKKKITADSAKRAVEAAKYAGIEAGAFFILCYPGETDETVLDTIYFAASLPLDYLSFTMPYPLKGTALYERVKDRIPKEWKAQDSMVSDHALIFDADFSWTKMRFAMMKGQMQFQMRKNLGPLAGFALWPFEILTDIVFRRMR